MTKQNDPWKFLRSSGIPFATWITIIIFGTLFYGDNQKFQKDTLEFQDDSKKRFDDFTKFREKQSERDNSLLLEVKTMGASLGTLIESMKEVRIEQKEIRGEQSKLNESMRDLKVVK
jgi:hypothetical protein